MEKDKSVEENTKKAYAKVKILGLLSEFDIITKLEILNKVESYLIHYEQEENQKDVD